MHNVHRMQAAQRHQQLLDNVDNLALSEALFFVEKFVKVASTHILHDDVVLFIALEQLNDPRDVGMVGLFKSV